MKKVLISDLKPGMRIVKKDCVVDIIDLAWTHRAANGRTVYYWNSKHNPPRKGLDRFIGCGDLTVEVEEPKP